MLVISPPIATYQEDPLATLDKDYGQAVLHLAWDKHKDSKQRNLLFALVELLPCEVPPPEDYGEQTIRLKSKNHRLFVRHLVLPASQALSWYRNCARGVAVRPNSKGHFEETPSPEDLFGDLRWDQEPAWPHLTCALPTWSTPFVSRWHYPARVHHLVATEFELATHWTTEDDKSEAADWLHEQLGFDLCKYSSLIGSIHLLAPNPVFRNFHYHHGKLLTEGFETVIYKADLRSGDRPFELTLIIRDDTPTGTGLLKAIPLATTSGAFVINREFNLQSVYVIDKYRGLLYGSESFYFPGGISMNMELVTSQRVIRDDDGKVVSKVPLIGQGGPVIEANALGRVSTHSKQAAAALRAESNVLRRRYKAQLYHERWFQGDKEAAVELIRSLLRRARRRVLIVDPYFRRTELKFILEVSNTTVPIRVLGSARVLKKVAVDHCPPKLKRARNVLRALDINREEMLPWARKVVAAGSWLPGDLAGLLKNRANDLVGNNVTLHADQLLQAVERANVAPKANPLEVRVMIGSARDVHDRFLLVDNDLWLLGSSLNEFGSRGTMIVPVIDPMMIEERLEENWACAETLQNWLRDRHTKREAHRL